MSRRKPPPLAPNRIKEVRKLYKLTQEQLAERADTTHPTIQRLENNKMEVTLAWLERIARAIPCTVGELIGIPVGQVRVVGAVAAGEWRDATEWDEDERYPAAYVPDPRYPGIKRFGLEVRGSSMNLVYPPGTVVVCVKIFDIGREPSAGERVVVQRYAHDQVEATLKEIVLDEQGRRWLWPRSSDPEHQQPWRVPDRHEKAAERLELWALVVGSYKPE